MFKRKEALRIKEKVEEQKIFLAFSHNDFITNEESIIYFYNSEESRKFHHNEIVRGGWELEENVTDIYMLYMPLSSNYDQRVWVYMTKYKRKFN